MRIGLDPIYLSSPPSTLSSPPSTLSSPRKRGSRSWIPDQVGNDTERKRQNLILFIGRLTHTKGPQDAIDAFKIISEKLTAYKLIIIGRGEENFVKGLKKQAKNLRVEFAGYVSEKEKADLLKKAKIILIPAVREGWNLVATEAQASGCVPIGYNVPGLRDSIQNNKTGILTPKDPKLLAESALKLLKNDRLRQKLQKNGLNFAKNFSWNNTYEDFKKIIFGIIK